MANLIAFNPRGYRPGKRRPDLLVIAAEPSGDEHATHLVKKYLERHPSAQIYAVGGNNLEQAGVHFLFNLAEHAAMGITEVLKNYRFFRDFLTEIIQWIETYRPRKICFVDSPSLNLRIAKALFRDHISIKGGGDVALFYYVAPQVWAWKAKRRFTMERLIDSLACLFPFELESFADTQLPTHFVGHPFTDSDAKSPIFYQRNQQILLLPGSREAVIRRMFPVILEAFQLLKNQNLKGICLYPNSKIQKILEEILQKNPDLENRVSLVSVDVAREQRIGAEAAIVTSGTMSLQCALEGIPGVILYKAHPLTYWIGRKLVKVHYLGIANLLLGYEAYPEYIQDAVQAETIAQRIENLIHARREFLEISENLRQILSPKALDLASWLDSIPSQDS